MTLDQKASRSPRQTAPRPSFRGPSSSASVRPAEGSCCGTGTARSVSLCPSAACMIQPCYLRWERTFAKRWHSSADCQHRRKPKLARGSGKARSAQIRVSTLPGEPRNRQRGSEKLAWWLLAGIFDSFTLIRDDVQLEDELMLFYAC